MKQLLVLIIMVSNMLTVSAFRVEYGNNIIISGPVYDDLYLAGGNITINAPIHGDLIIAGGTVIINDSVTGDILLAGGNVTFNGYVGDDIRCAGGNIRISKNVTGDVVMAGGSVIVDKAVTIGGLLASGGNVTLDGNVSGKVTGAFGDLFLNSTVAGDIDCRGGRITVNGNIGGKAVLAAKNIIIGNAAAFNNDIRYWNNKGSLDVKQSLKNGRAIYDPSLRFNSGEWYYLGAMTILGLLWYLGMALLMIFIVQYLFSATMLKAASTVFEASLKSLGSGFLFFIGVPIAAILAFITVIGVPVGLILIFSYIALILLATVITSIVAANWFNGRNNHHWNYWQLCFASFGIFILLKLLSSLPFAGWLLVMVMVCMAYGGILLNVRWKKKQTLNTSAG